MMRILLRTEKFHTLTILPLRMARVKLILTSKHKKYTFAAAPLR